MSGYSAFISGKRYSTQKKDKKVININHNAKPRIAHSKNRHRDRNRNDYKSIFHKQTESNESSNSTSRHTEVTNNTSSIKQTKSESQVQTTNGSPFIPTDVIPCYVPQTNTCQTSTFENNPKIACQNKGLITVKKCLLAECSARKDDADIKVLIFDIMITNRTCKKLADISLNDSILGLMKTLRQIEVTVVSYSKTIQPLPSDKILEKDGELLDSCRSFVNACDSAKLVLKIQVKGFIKLKDGSRGCLDIIKPCDLLTANNTLILNGKLITSYTCKCCTRQENIDPVFHVSSAQCINNKCNKNSKCINNYEYDDIMDTENACGFNYNETEECTNEYDITEN